MTPPGSPAPTSRVLRGAALGSVLGLVAALLLHAVDAGAVNPWLIGSFGGTLGAGVAADRHGDG
jgi:hypothetical protein